MVATSMHAQPTASWSSPAQHHRRMPLDLLRMQHFKRRHLKIRIVLLR